MVRRILDDPAAVYLWVAVTLAAVVVAVAAGEPVLAVTGWVVASVAAVVLVAVKARRGRQKLCQGRYRAGSTLISAS